MVFWGMNLAKEAPASSSDDSQEKSEAEPQETERKVKRREKNRAAAQRSRQKQTEKADVLHQEYQCLERENACLKKEIENLKLEQKQLSEILKEHESRCMVGCSTIDDLDRLLESNFLFMQGGFQIDLQKL
ncbi:basic leucine zipper transcriptional factor ATF-like 3 [Latimeria chalumnae]|uniref:basic leucine zipper transcriptional factor ATF-like 3 n=1 Tax=Latimeria chalumnae TaxID=7897 RepID=UPI0003C1A4BF|nr:PREDICTED: basic leucine zipper transcriptional factor ATF-like 2 [Latimeria chalumnae]|eukprot:XP_006004651.1 PREDICTED: basic leucine zipper transcriptional factor ATF-like 2 [Latimeria chalumnae]